MKLQYIEISNYRCIEKTKIEINQINGSNSFCFFGINESGKSSLLKGIHLLDSDKIEYPYDYYEEDKPIQIEFLYTISKSTMNLIRSKLIKDFNFPKEVATQIDANAVLLHAEFSPTNSHEKKNTEFIFFKTDIIKGYK